MIWLRTRDNARDEGECIVSIQDCYWHAKSSLFRTPSGRSGGHMVSINTVIITTNMLLGNVIISVMR